MCRTNTEDSRFVICNEGYTIERYIHGMDATYNDIQQWRYKDLVGVFGADPKKSKTYQVKTKQEAEDLFKDGNFSSAPYLQVGLFEAWGVRMLIIAVCGALHAQRGCTKSTQNDCRGFS